MSHKGKIVVSPTFGNLVEQMADAAKFTEQLNAHRGVMLAQPSFDVMLDWTRESPQEEGCYLFLPDKGDEPVRKMVRKGDWMKRQNPDWFYSTNYDSKPLHALDGWWLGPIGAPNNS